MIQQYNISGMTCGVCVAKVKAALESIPGVGQATVQLAAPQAELTLAQDLSLASLQAALGKYKIVPIRSLKAVVDETALAEKSFTTYRPLAIIIAFILGVSLLVQYPFSDFSIPLWMRHFMAGFFLVFAFFKLLNVKGFAESYQMYDLVAGRWKSWGSIYPFVELALGILYLINIAPFYTNLATLFILGVSSIGVIQSNLNKRQIKCACLGDVFNLPMSTVTVVEDLTMVVMAVIMLFI